MLDGSRARKILSAVIFLVLIVVYPHHTVSVGSYDLSLYSVTRAAFTVGGTSGAGGEHNVSGSLGQPTPIGVGTSGNNTLYAGIYGGSLVLTSTGDMPKAFANRLHQNYPNPFNPSTTVSYTVGNGGHVTIEIYSVNGRRIRLLVDEVKDPGIHTVTWDGRNEKKIRVATGIYFCRLRIDSFSTVRKMLLIQ